jgi:hypothetical protein
VVPVGHTGGVEDVIAVAVRLADGRQRYFLTWGRTAWKASVAQKMEAGPEIWYCGQPG